MSGQPATAVDELRPVAWSGAGVRLLDQRLLPGRESYLQCESVHAVADAIATMVVRGAPAIGIAAAYGVALAARAAWLEAGSDWRSRVGEPLARLRAARPTAVNLAWAVDRLGALFPGLSGDPFPELLAAARRVHEADVAANRAMGGHGAALLGAGARVLTHCNAGALATGGYGTALGVVRAAAAAGRLGALYAGETRPWLQGARLTAWELLREGIEVRIIADAAAAHLMRTSGLDWVIVGADRVAANGDVANKIGTYALAVLARAHGVRLMVVAPLSSIDRTVACGAAIPIEERAGEELLEIAGTRVAAAGAAAWNPVFDVTPAALVDCLVTERGVVPRPDSAGIERLF